MLQGSKTMKRITFCLKIWSGLTGPIEKFNPDILKGTGIYDIYYWVDVKIVLRSLKLKVVKA